MSMLCIILCVYACMHDNFIIILYTYNIYIYIMYRQQLCNKRIIFSRNDEMNNKGIYLAELFVLVHGQLFGLEYLMGGARNIGQWALSGARHWRRTKVHKCMISLTWSVHFGSCMAIVSGCTTCHAKASQTACIYRNK